MASRFPGQRALQLVLASLALSGLAGAGETQQVREMATYEVGARPAVNVSGARPKHVILVIGDGMGLSAVTSAMVANKGRLNLDRAPVIGLISTWSADNLVTDSAAGATALGTGKKGANYTIGLDEEGQPAPSLFVDAKKAGWATGVVVTSRVTHATPGSFLAHVSHRKSEQEIALGILAQPMDVVVGGGADMFVERDDGRDLKAELRAQGRTVVDGLEAVLATEQTPMVGFLAQGDPPRAEAGRGDALQRAVLHAQRLLDADPDGSFMMVEGSQVDWGGHDNDARYLIGELLDLDQMVGALAEAVSKRNDTLIVVTADHETGGLSLLGGDLARGEVEASWATHEHSATLIPVYAFGPGAERFAGVYDNTEIHHRIAAIIAGK